jgi:probable phosphoglycerate mutase
LSTLPQIYLARHGETAWTLTGQHTGLTDLQRARRTCELSGFGAAAQIEPDLLEWNYGEFEGRVRGEILKSKPDWQLFRDGCPGGESPQQVAVRADRVIARTRAVNGNVLLFSSGHFLRMLAARWIGLAPAGGAGLILDTASLSILGYEHDLTEPVIRLWNEFE